RRRGDGHARRAARDGGTLLRAGARLQDQALHQPLRTRHHRLHGGHRRLRRDRAGVGHVRHLPPGEHRTMTLAVGRLGRGERGDTLVEVLVAIVIVGVAFVAILGGMATSIVGSDIHRKQSTEETALASLAEAMKDDQAVPYANCATTASYPVPASV